MCDLGASVSAIPKSLCDILGFHEIEECSLNLHLADSNCNPTCPIILGRPFLRTIGAIIDMKEGNIRFQFPLKKVMENFPRKKIRLPYESMMRATYGLSTKDDDT